MKIIVSILYTIFPKLDSDTYPPFPSTSVTLKNASSVHTVSNKFSQNKSHRKGK